MPNPIQDAPGEHTGTVLVSFVDAGGLTQQVSAANPLPTAGGGATGSVTAAGVNGTVAQAVQGITGGVPFTIPIGAATSANQVDGGPQTGSGVITGTTQRVTLATDGPEVTNSTAIKNSVASVDIKLTDGTQLSRITDGTNTVGVSTIIVDDSSITANRLRVAAVGMAFDGTNIDAVRAGVIGENGAATGYSNVIPATGAVSGATRVSSSAYEASRVLKASPGTLISLSGYNSRTTNQFVQIYNSATVPADTAVPIATFIVYAQSNFSYDVPVTGLPMTTGISVSNSSTGPTKTIGAADIFFTAVIK